MFLAIVLGFGFLPVIVLNRDNWFTKNNCALCDQYLTVVISMGYTRVSGQIEFFLILVPEVLACVPFTKWSNKTKQAIQLIYNIYLFDLKKRTKYIWETEQDPSIHKRTKKNIN